MKTKLKIAAGVFAILILTSCGGKEDDSGTETYKPVKYGIVELSGGIKERTFNGVSKSSSETNLSFRSNGLMVKLSAKIGQRVQRGKLLGQLDQKDVLISYEKAKVELRNMEVQLETSKSNLERVKQLYQSNNASLNDYELAKSGFSNAQSNFEAAKRGVDLQRSQIQYTKIIAPMNGVISDVNGSINEFVQAGTPIVVMSSGKADAEVEIGIPEGYINRVTQGQNVKVSFLATEDKIYNGVVTEVAYSTAGASTFLVTVKITDASVDIRPGMAGKVTFKFGSADVSSQLVVPVKAVGDDPAGNFVFILEKQENYYLAKKIKVEIGALVSEGFIVQTGLNEGDYVAIAGIRSLFDGKKVSLLK